MERLIRVGQVSFVCLVFCFIYLPIVSLIAFSFNSNRFPSLPWRDITAFASAIGCVCSAFLPWGGEAARTQTAFSLIPLLTPLTTVVCVTARFCGGVDFSLGI